MRFWRDVGEAMTEAFQERHLRDLAELTAPHVGGIKEAWETLYELCVFVGTPRLGIRWWQ